MLGGLCHSDKTLIRVWHDKPAHQVEVGHRERCECPSGVLHQSAIAHLREPPKPLHDPERMLSTRSGSRPALVHLLLVLRERVMVRATSIHPILHPIPPEPLPIGLFPISLIPEHLTLLTVEQSFHLCDVRNRCMRRDQAVYHSSPVGPDVNLHAEVPRLSFLRLAHLRIT